jgi:hypothetical protein
MCTHDATPQGLTRGEKRNNGVAEERIEPFSAPNDALQIFALGVCMFARVVCMVLGAWLPKCREVIDKVLQERGTGPNILSLPKQMPLDRQGCMDPLSISVFVSL